MPHSGLCHRGPRGREAIYATDGHKFTSFCNYSVLPSLNKVYYYYYTKIRYSVSSTFATGCSVAGAKSVASKCSKLGQQV